MKRLRVLLVCFIVALLCWYHSQHVYCSEQSSSGSGLAVQDKDLDSQEQDSTQNQAVEEWTTHTSYEMGLETEKLANTLGEQTVNQVEAGTGETEPEPELEPTSVVPEPAPTPEPQADLDLQTHTPHNDQEAAESEPILDHVSVDDLPQAEIPGKPSLEPDSQTPPDEAEHVPTSQSAGSAHTGAVWVASAGDELPVDSFVFAEHSDSQCRVIPLKLATCENSPFGSPILSNVDEPEEQPSGQSADLETEVQVDPEVADSKQQQRQELEEGLSSLVQEGNISLHHHQQMVGADVKTADTSVPSKDDFHTFDEWRKQVMEVEKEKSQTLHTSTSSGLHPVKKVQKNFKNNYASVECGAKILSANNEAKSTSAILMENMDLYMLNPCSNKIWFVIELCEPIQVKQLDIANFELFSSTPKDFLVSISDRYPTNKWVKLGTFHARDERIVQSFPLDEQLYAKYVKMFIKYIKIELLSHFGSEHFCPLSLFRVFGTSMVEEYEEIADSQYPSERLEYLEEDYDYPLGYQPSEEKASKNLLGSATNAILNMVNNIAANVLGGKPELEGGAEARGNTTEEGDERQSADTKPEAPDNAAELDPLEPEQPAVEEEQDLNVSSDSSLSDSRERRQIVTLVEDEEDEDLRQTVILLEEGEEEEEEEKSEEKTRREADRNQWESQAYCPFSCFSSLSLSCVATLPELLHRWCSSRLAKERLRSLRRRQLSSETLTHSTVHTPIPTHTPAPIPAAPPTQETPPLTLDAPESEVLANEGTLMGEIHTTEMQTNTQSPNPHTPDVTLLLEPSRTSTIPSHSFSPVESSLTQPTPTHEEKLLPPGKDAALDPVPTPPLQTLSIPETQQASSAILTPSVSSPSQPLSSEKDSSSAVASSVKDQPAVSLPTASRPEDLSPPPTELPAAVSQPDPPTDTVKLGMDTGGDTQRQNLQLSELQGEQVDPLSQTGEDSVEGDVVHTNGNVQRTATDFYAELQSAGDYNGVAINGNGVLLNGGAVHGSSQKESVFMRLNNRIKALEMNMSLSSRYLEELSQRYRKQMEEMQKAFNKTIIKLQNTSRIAEEQDQKQTESIQVLQSQLENVTTLMLNLTATVSQLQREVTDRQSHLLVALVLCLFLGLLLCLQCCRGSPPGPSTGTVALPKSNHYPSPKRCFSSYDDMSLKRRVTCPLVRSKSFQLSSPERPDDLYIVEPLRFSPEKKKKRGKTKSLDKVETLKPFDPSVLFTNEDLKCNGFHPSLPALPPPPPLLPPPPPPPPPLPSVDQVSSLPSCSSKEVPSETSSCSSSTHSEESYTSRLPPPSPIYPSADMCNGHGLSFPLAKSRQEKRWTKRRKSRQTELQFPHEPGGGVGSLPSLQELMKGNKELNVRTIGVTAVPGHA
ncbi:SUN domain-containing ossification factor isoform X2 [Nothobranchius furzeri]|uniref:SUN domain-containing ossification factor isoform X2 n=1 Tax=Nothobranchius furzeri TaxID=105023 RepID=UPI003904D8EB